MKYVKPLVVSYNPQLTIYTRILQDYFKGTGVFTPNASEIRVTILNVG